MVSFSQIYKWYRYNVFPDIRSFRGSTRLLLLLRKLALRPVEDVSEKPRNIKDLNWEDLIIIDGCRKDLYEEIYDSTGVRITEGSSSSEFIAKTFSNTSFQDTVVVTANPHYEDSIFTELTGQKPGEVFHEIFRSYERHWNNELGTVLAESVIQDVELAKKLFPEKRVLVHFMQPHYPFVRSSLTESGFKPDLNEGTEMSVWESAEKGNQDYEELWDAYKQNLRYVMEEIKSHDIWSENTLITSDHGNLVGENGLYGHPENSSARVLRRVPLFRLKT